MVYLPLVTLGYRGGDQVASVAYAGLAGLGLSMTGIAIVAVPISTVWLGLSVWLGRRQEIRVDKDQEGVDCALVQEAGMQG